ncbi:hypothetical protein D9M69_629180 [compost metagenome]
MHQWGHQGVHQQQGRKAFEAAEGAGRHQAHVEQEEGQHAFEQVHRERCHGGLAGRARHGADQHRPQQQQLGTVGERLVQDLAQRCAAHRGTGQPG